MRLTQFLLLKGPRGTDSQRWTSRALQSFTNTYLPGRKEDIRITRTPWHMWHVCCIHLGFLTSWLNALGEVPQGGSATVRMCILQGGRGAGPPGHWSAAQRAQHQVWRQPIGGFSSGGSSSASAASSTVGIEPG